MIIRTVSSTDAIRSLEEIFCGSSIMSEYSTSSFSVLAHFILSASVKSVRYCFAIASVTSSPAYGIMPYAIILPSLVMEISDVPAPTSTKAIFNRRNLSGIATLIAAIGSNVRFATYKPARSTAAYKPSTTSSGKKVAISSVRIFEHLCPSRFEIG